MRRISKYLGATIILILGHTQHVRAQSSNAAAADVLFQVGKTALQAGDYATACSKLTESYRLDPATGTLLALAMCHEAQGKQATAWSEYSEAAVKSKREGRDDRERAALDKVQTLKSQLSYLTIQLSPEARTMSGLQITRDGVQVGPASMGVSLPVDAGAHLVQAVAPGKQPFSVQVTLAPDGTNKIVVIPRLADNAAAYSPAAAPQETRRAGSRASSWTNLQITGLAVAGAGVVGLGIGSAFGLHAVSRKNRSEPGCNSGNQCTTADSFQARKDSVTAANRATVAFVAGGVLIAGGATLYIVGQPRRAEQGPYVTAAPYALPGEAGLSLGGQF